MAEAPWLTIVGIGEDGAEGLPAASLRALQEAAVVIAPPRHLSLLPEGLGAERIAWPVPFADGLALLPSLRGRATVALVSGDPFWFGGGASIARVLGSDEWRALPGVSTFALAAARMGWSVEKTVCLGLHAAPLARLRPHLAPGARLLVLLRDGDAVQSLAGYLDGAGFGASRIAALCALGGPREARVEGTAADFPGGAMHPVCAAVEVVGDGPALPRCSGLPDAAFTHDGQITKRPVRAMTLSALAPLPGERLWDVGGGSGSVSVEWMLAAPGMAASCIEPRADRLATIRANMDAFGLTGMQLVEGAAPEALEGLPAPDAVFVGGGLSAPVLDAILRLAPRARIVANAVTLESQALLIDAQARLGGGLVKMDLAEAAPLGRMRGWKSAWPLVQWSYAP